jgi:hypothetical protein
MQFTFEQIIAYISESETLYPGDFLRFRQWGRGEAPGVGWPGDRRRKTAA